MTTGIIINHRVHLGWTGARSWQTICVDKKFHINSDAQLSGGRTNDGGNWLHDRRVYRIESVCKGSCSEGIVPSTADNRGKTIDLPSGVDDLIKRYVESDGADCGEFKEEAEKEWKDR